MREMRAVQPQGPYHLGGDCLGGVLAYEVAQQLRAAGTDVALVAMIDSFHPRYRPYTPGPVYEGLHRLRLLLSFHLGTVIRLPWPEKVKYVRSRTSRHRLVARSGLAARLRGLLTSRNVLPKDPLLRTQSALNDAFDAYEPKPYDGRVVLFRSAQQPFGIRRDAALGWNGFPAELEVRTIPAYFTTIVYEPAVRLLAVELRGCLEDLDRRARADPLVGGSVRV